ncbi:MAG: alanyl-tRNA editing protein, partial [Spirochaeta sp.]|nr:alanyl-tRNA editing protein [Spirochaeta sp.]
MTTALYYDDPMALDFTATVQNVSTDQRTIVLDQTLFYPEGGGQPADTGTIAGIRVVDVQKENGVISHTLGDVFGGATGDTVDGRVDGAHRFEYMQQHSGQHVLSAALLEVAGAGTVSVAQGSEFTSIEVDTETLTDEQIAAVEERANRAIRADLPIIGFSVDDTELAEYALRRPTKRSGKIRLVRIGDADAPFDLVACGGVHLTRTGLLNLVQTVGVERIRGHQRLHFKIGDRALTDYREKHRAITEAAELFSARPTEVPTRIRQEQTEAQELRRVQRLQAERIAGLLLQTHLAGTETVLAITLAGEDGEVFKALAETAGTTVTATGAPVTAVVLTNVQDGAVHWAIAVGGDAPFPAERLRADLLTPFGAKGGGKPPLWRGILPEGGADTA